MAASFLPRNTKIYGCKRNANNTLCYVSKSLSVILSIYDTISMLYPFVFAVDVFLCTTGSRDSSESDILLTVFGMVLVRVMAID